MKSRIILVFVLFAVLWCGLLLRAAVIQIIPNSKLSELKKRQLDTVIKIQSRRGDILDRNGQELAVSIPAFSIFADPKVIKAPRKFSKQLAPILGISWKSIYDKIKDDSRRFVWLDRKVSLETKNKILDLKENGLGVVPEARRIYPNESLASGILGFVGAEGSGLEGIELRYNDFLEGTETKLNLKRDARGRPLIVDGKIFTEMPEGAQVHLTLDRDLQYSLEKELSHAVSEFNADSAIGIILDPKTSEVLAMANVPTFNSNSPAETDLKWRRNRTLTDPIEPGSTMKVFTIAAALQSRKVAPNTEIDCENGEFKIGKRTIREADSKHRFKILTVNEILQKSSNIGSSKIALMLGAEELQRSLALFGFGSKTGVDLGGESKGVLPNLPWNDHLTANVSFGHGISATPLQIANAYAVIANGGVLNTPYLVKSITTQDADLSEDRRKGKRIISEELAQQLKFLLMGTTMEGGTGVRAKIAGFPVAGKTGTAQKARLDQLGYLPNSYVSSFAGFVPATDPQFVIYVAVDNPKTLFYGSDVAAPLFSRIGHVALRKYGVAPVLLTEVKEDSIEQAIFETKKVSEVSRKIVSLSVGEPIPELAGVTLREVLRSTQGLEIELQIHGSGSVYRTQPAAGTVLSKESTFQVFLK